MAPKIILCLTNDRRTVANVMDRALGLAQRFSAHIVALHVRPDAAALMAQVDGQYFATMSGAVFSKIEQEAAESARAVREALELWRIANGIVAGPAEPDKVTLDFRDIVGPLEAIIARHAQLSDLVLLSRPDPAEAPLDEVALEATLFAAGRPALIMPLNGAARFSATALVAWNASLESTHAMAAALPLLEQMETVEVATVGEQAEDDASVEEVAAYLRTHRIAAAARHLDAGALATGRAILDHAQAIDAGLIVMGAYTHSRVREFLMGGVTRDALKGAKVPVLLAH